MKVKWTTYKKPFDPGGYKSVCMPEIYKYECRTAPRTLHVGSVVGTTSGFWSGENFVVEYNGKFEHVPMSLAKPATPEDIDSSPAPNGDGIIITEAEYAKLKTWE